MRAAARSFALISVMATAACAPAVPVVAPPVVTWEQKLADIVRLEDARVLADVAPPIAPIPPAAKGRLAAAPLRVPDLTVLLTDQDARVRRRAALAIGRVGLQDGVAPLRSVLRDADAEVREMAAFALGLLGGRTAVPDLRTSLASDDDLRVRGRAAEALGAIGDADAVADIGRLASSLIASGALAGIDPASLEERPAPPVDACRLALFALVRLKATDAVLATVVGQGGAPVSEWWPIAYALQRAGGARALEPLMALAASRSVETRAFVARGLGPLKDARAVPVLLQLADVSAHEARVVAAAVRSLGQIGRSGDARVVSLLVGYARDTRVDSNVRLEATVALGTTASARVSDALLDVMGDPWPALRAAAMRALAELDPDTLLTALSGQDADADHAVRAELATTAATLGAERGLPLVRLLVADTDARVVADALRALATLSPPDLDQVLVAHLDHEDVIVRATAATLLGERKVSAAGAALDRALERSVGDSLFDARVATLEALAVVRPAGAAEVWRRALTDAEWAVRRVAGERLRALDAAADVSSMRPAPTGRDAGWYRTPSLVAPPYSPHAFVDTVRGTIEIELDVVQAPLTTAGFVALARRGYFDGLVFHRVVPNFVVQGGDPRGDGNGSPGYAIRDELSDVPYLRGTVGMALSGPDTGGSQFFITHGPQPHLDGRYAVFGRVVAGLDVVDRLRRGDRIERVRVWDGVDATGLR